LQRYLAAKVVAALTPPHAGLTARHEDADSDRLRAALAPALTLFTARFPRWWDDALPHLAPLPLPGHRYPQLEPSEAVVAADDRVTLFAGAVHAARPTTPTAHLLAARRISTGYKGFLAAAGRDLEARKARLARVVTALEHDDVHTADTLASNAYSQGPFYQYHPRSAL